MAAWTAAKPPSAVTIDSVGLFMINLLAYYYAIILSRALLQKRPKAQPNTAVARRSNILILEIAIVTPAPDFDRQMKYILPRSFQHHDT